MKHNILKLAECLEATEGKQVTVQHVFGDIICCISHDASVNTQT